MSWGFAFVEFVDIQVSQLLPCCQDCSLFFPHRVLICSSCGINVGSTTSFWLSYCQASHCSVICTSALISTSCRKHASGRVLHPVSSFGLRSTKDEQFLHSSQSLRLICVIARFVGHGMLQCRTCGSDRHMLPMSHDPSYTKHLRTFIWCAAM